MARKIFSAILAALLFVNVIMGLASCSEDSVDYINDDLSEYVYISSEDYKNFPVSVPLLTVDEYALQREITSLLVKNKNKEPLFSGASVRPDNYTIKLGDVANIWYRGYTVDENGVEIDIENSSNFDDSSPYPLEIGSGSFIQGIEEALVGKTLHSKGLQVLKSGKVQAGDVIYISYSAFLPNGTPGDFSAVKIDLSNKSAVDKVYGNGFADFFIDKAIGENTGIDQAFRIEGDSIDTVYYDIVIDYAVRCEEEPYVVDVVFPADYKDASMRGVEAKFEIYASTVIVYPGIPEWNDSFITETLKVTAESLAEYEGATIVEKYENKMRKDISDYAEEVNRTLIEEEMWKYYRSKAEIKKLPKTEVNEVYRQYRAEVQNYYDIYGANFNSFDEFAAYYFGLGSDVTWDSYITTRAEEVIAERLIFYYIVNKEGFLPTDEEYDRIYDECMQEYKDYYLELYKTEIDACKTEEEKAEKIAEIEKEMIEYYGEDYFSEIVYYEYAIAKLVDFADTK